MSALTVWTCMLQKVGLCMAYPFWKRTVASASQQCSCKSRTLLTIRNSTWHYPWYSANWALLAKLPWLLNGFLSYASIASDSALQSVRTESMYTKDLFPLRLRCAARCDRYRNADSVSISIYIYRNAQRSTIVHYLSLSQRSAVEILFKS